jgi:endoglucanase
VPVDRSDARSRVRTSTRPSGGRARHRRAAGRVLAGVVAALCVLLPAMLLPGSAAVAETRDLIVNGNFDPGAGHQPWWVTSNLTYSTTSNELCVSVPAGGNLWDSIAGQKDITLDNNIDYTLQFAARATQTVSIQTRVQPLTNPGAITYLLQNQSVTTTLQHFEYVFTPSLGAAQMASQLQLRLGANSAAYTICLDSVSLVGNYPDDPTLGTDELLTNGTFAASAGSKPWWTNANMAMDVSTGAMCLNPTASVNRWDRVLGQNSITLQDHTKYLLSFDAQASTTVQMQANVGPFDNPGNITYLSKFPTVGTTSKHFSFMFETSLGADHVRAQLQLRLGGAAAGYSICFDNISIRGTAFHYVPDTGPAVKVDQVGYLPHGPKNATLVSADPNPLPWTLKQGGVDVAQGSTTPTGEDTSSGVDVHTIDFTTVTATGDGFTLEVAGQASHPFSIRADIFQSLRTDALKFFYTNRSGIAIDGNLAGAAYARPAGHLGVAPNQGDTSVGCQDPQSFTDNWTCDYTLDVRGGWYDAGDHGKYVVNGGIAVYQVMSTWERAHASGADAPLGDSTLGIPERGNGVPDILDEARWELDFLLEMQVPAGKDLAGMVHHKIGDAEWTGPPMLPSADPKRRILHRPSTAATLNLAAVAAQGARLFAPYDPAYAARLLAAARTAYAAAIDHPMLYAPSADGVGSGAYADSNVTDEFYWAAAELYVTTGESAFESAVLSDPLHTDATIFSPGGFYWGGVAALARLDLARYAPQLPHIDQVRASVIDAATELASTEESEAFGQPYAPTDNQWAWGSNASILNNQVVLATAYDLNQDPRFARAVVESFDYLFGRNVLGMSYVTGYGDVYAKNQHTRWYAHSLDSAMPNPPVGSVAGGPNTSIQDQIAKERLTGCVGQWCYVDDIEAWSVNEITVNWNSALTWVASFVADQSDGESTVSTPAQVTSSPSDIVVTEGDGAVLTAAATGKPAPAITWQRSTDGATWSMVNGATGPTLTLPTLTSTDNGVRYRAVFTNGIGTPGESNPATVTVVPAPTPAPTPSVSATIPAPAPTTPSPDPATPTATPDPTTPTPATPTPDPTTPTPTPDPTTPAPAVTSPVPATPTAPEPDPTTPAPTSATPEPEPTTPAPAPTSSAPAPSAPTPTPTTVPSTTSASAAPVTSAQAVEHPSATSPQANPATGPTAGVLLRANTTDIEDGKAPEAAAATPGSRAPDKEGLSTLTLGVILAGVGVALTGAVVGGGAFMKRTRLIKLRLCR